MMHRLRTRTARAVFVMTLAIAIAGASTPAFAALGMPVYRLYNSANGTHFYTSSQEEMVNAQAKWPTIFAYEGISFYTDGLAPESPLGASGQGIEFGVVPLYRFYNVKNGSHFYTISADERDTVKAKYGSIYTYEGAAFNVLTSNPYGDFAPVYRFYNKVNGSHFYTISMEEKVLVQSMWSNTYLYEGIAFYARQYYAFK